MSILVVSPPEDVLTMEECKRHLRVDHDDDDVLIASLARAAEQHLAAPAGWLGRSIGRQTLEVWRDLLQDAFVLPAGPVISIESITYLDASGVTQTVPPDVYELEGWMVVPAYGRSWPQARRCSVRVRYVAGYAVDKVPAPLRQAMLLLVGLWYANREAATDRTLAAIPFAVEALASPYRIWV